MHQDGNVSIPFVGAKRWSFRPPFIYLLERSYRQGEGNKLPETIGPELHNEKSYFINDKFLNGKQRFNGKLLGWICEWSVKKSKTLQRLAVSTRSPLGRCIRADSPYGGNQWAIRGETFATCEVFLKSFANFLFHHVAIIASTCLFRR